MLVASEFAFKRIIGVECSARLCDIARSNIARYASPTQRCRAFEVHCRDAAEFDVPEDVGILYFYEPFSGTVATTVLANVERSLSLRPRRAVLCFVGRGLRRLGRPGWSQLGAVVASPDDPYYDARIYTNQG